MRIVLVDAVLADAWISRENWMFREPRRLEELPPFDPRTIEVVRKSCAALPSDSVLLTEEFYKQLFDMAPQARPCSRRT